MTSDLDGFSTSLRARGLQLRGPLTILEETESTNDLAKDAAKNGAPHGAIFLAESQTRGRGRQGRAWVSPPGENLLFSVVTRFHLPIGRLTTIPIVTGLALAETVREAVSEPSARVGLKWPNDVLVDGKKIAGILVESVGKADDPALIIGIGLNVHTRSFPKDLAATSLALLRDTPPSRPSVLLELLAALDRDLPLAAGRGLQPFASRLEAVDLLRGSEVHAESGASGIARGIDDDGRLVVEAPDGVRHRWSSGEVHLVRRG